MRLTSRSLSSSVGGLSAVHRGAAFEERSLNILQAHLSMSLRRVGGKSDGGIDLLGWWWLPPAIDTGSPSTPYIPNDTAARRRLRILCQCKAEKKKMGPNYVREMEGVLHHYIATSTDRLLLVQPPTPRGPAAPAYLPPMDTPAPPPLVALLVSESPFTKSALLRAHSSPVPLFLLHIPSAGPNGNREPGDAHGHPIGSAFWNPALAGVRGLLGGRMEARWERAAGGEGGPGLWWCGRRLESWTPGRGEVMREG